jgi:hypothetical protein
MEEQVLAPGVQDGGHANLGAQPLRIGRQLEERLGGCLEQQIVQHGGVAQHQWLEQSRQGEDHMEVSNRQ